MSVLFYTNSKWGPPQNVMGIYVVNNLSIKVCTWHVTGSHQGVNQSVYMECCMSSCCEQAANQNVYILQTPRYLYVQVVNKLSIKVRNGMFQTHKLCTSCQSKCMPIPWHMDVSSARFVYQRSIKGKCKHGWPYSQRDFKLRFKLN